MPISAAILVRSEGTGLAQMLADSRALREQMELAGLGRAEESGLPMLRSLLVIWVLPDTVFDDADWPGDNPAARRAAAGAWLAKEGIGLALVA